ncbi:Epi9-like protease inhibitor [Phytophthora palmivora]|uniref:Epi9-like protease inhibitor n=1 Tax=Phytophthora palmivora TaxID=4796 RepID=A0A2P4XTU4_9STRA|nr:Epi9-like protease inhibitor [Phytophthora palmivora]
MNKVIIVIVALLQNWNHATEKCPVLCSHELLGACGSNGVTDNECLFEVAQCKNLAIRMKYKDKCRK